MLTPFLKYVSEGRVIRRHSDLQRYTFPEVTERIYLSFLALSLLRNLEQSKTFTKMYADQTMAKGTFDQVRMMNNDLANMLAIVSGDPDITKKLKNKNQAQAMRQRQPVPVMAIRRYLRTFEEPFKFLLQLERSLDITDANYRNLRRAIADYHNLDSKTKQKASSKLLQLLKNKLPGTDITRKVQEIIK
jgi:predicted O-linked N-acetylglucosamine transferase (SPINDLY family)|tara:strand:+ start:3993 stop:4559 length:567 start_codon:yes stop_codon:yes gene_type:complete